MRNVIFNKKVLPLTCSSLAAKTGDFAYEVVFAIIAIELLSFDFFHMGVVYFFRFIPYLIFGPVGGWLADAFAQKYNMLLSDAFRFIIAVLLYVVYLSGALDIYVLVLCSMAMSIGRSLFQPSFRAHLPAVLEKEDLPAGNSLLQVIEDIASILGPLVCALIINFGGKSSVILMYATSYLVSISFLLLLKINHFEANNHFSFSAIFGETKEIVMSMRKQNRNLFMVIGGTSVCVIFTASLLRFVLPASILDVYGDEALVGYVLSIMSCGTVLGGMCYTLLVKDSTPIQLMKSWMIYGLLFLAVSIAVNINLASVMITVFFLGFSGATVDISIITNIQSLSAKGEMGKNYGIFSTVTNACEAASGLFSGIFSLLAGGLSFSIIALFIAMAAKTVIFKIERMDCK